MPLERVSTADGIWFHNETIILFHTASVLTSRNTKRSCFFHIAISIWSSFFLKPFNSFHIQREHSDISQLTILKDLHFSNMIWMCIFSQSQAIMTNQLSMLISTFMYIFIYKYTYIHIYTGCPKKWPLWNFSRASPCDILGPVGPLIWAILHHIRTSQTN